MVKRLVKQKIAGGGRKHDAGECEQTALRGGESAIAVGHEELRRDTRRPNDQQKRELRRYGNDKMGAVEHKAEKGNRNAEQVEIKENCKRGFALPQSPNLSQCDSCHESAEQREAVPNIDSAYLRARHEKHATERQNQRNHCPCLEMLAKGDCRDHWSPNHKSIIQESGVGERGIFDAEEKRGAGNAAGKPAYKQAFAVSAKQVDAAHFGENAQENQAAHKSAQGKFPTRQ